MKLEIIEERKCRMLNEKSRTEKSRFKIEPREDEVMFFMDTAIRNGILRSTTTKGSRAIYKRSSGWI